MKGNLVNKGTHHIAPLEGSYGAPINWLKALVVHSVKNKIPRNAGALRGISQRTALGMMVSLAVRMHWDTSLRAMHRISSSAAARASLPAL